MTSESTTITMHCTFCKKTNTEVRKLIAGPGVYICDECIALCNNILDEEETTGAQPPSERAPSLEQGLPLERLVSIFGGMAETARSMDGDLRVWATRLRQRGVTTAERRTLGASLSQPGCELSGFVRQVSRDHLSGGPSNTTWPSSTATTRSAMFVIASWWVATKTATPWAAAVCR